MIRLSELGINYSAPDLMVVCVDGRRNSDIYGRIYHRQSGEPVRFPSTARMLREMDGVMERLGFPQRAVEDRNFKQSGRKADAAGREKRGQTDMKKNSMEQTGLNRAGLNRAELSRTALRRSGSDQSEADRADEAAVGNDMTIEEAGGDATFVVHVQYRQNATWQGRVTWAEKKQSCNFRSALELLKLIDSALDENDGAEEQE